MRHTKSRAKRLFATIFLISCAIQFIYIIPNNIIDRVAFQYSSQRAPCDYFLAHELTNCSTKDYTWNDIYDSHRLIYVDGDGTLLERVCLFNLALDRARIRFKNSKSVISSARGADTAESNLKEKVRMIISNLDDDFLVKLSQHSQVITVGLVWRTSSDVSFKSSSVLSSEDLKHDLVNLLVHDYFTWCASESLCRTISETSGFERLIYNGSYRYVCNTNLSSDVIVRPRSLPLLFLNSLEFKYARLYLMVDNDESSDESDQEMLKTSPIKVKRQFKSPFQVVPKRTSSIAVKRQFKSPSHVDPKKISPVDVKQPFKAPRVHTKQMSPISVYCHIIRDAIVTDEGDIFAHDLKLVSYGCSDNRSPEPPWETFFIPTYDEVFVIAQHWGNEVFHLMIEVMPRVVAFLDFLTRHPEIKILASVSSNGRLVELFRVVGLNPGRIVTGFARARIAYVPRPTMCGLANVQELQLLSNIYRRYITKNLYEKFERRTDERRDTSMVGL